MTTTTWHRKDFNDDHNTVCKTIIFASSHCISPVKQYYHFCTSEDYPENIFQVGKLCRTLQHLLVFAREHCSHATLDIQLGKFYHIDLLKLTLNVRYSGRVSVEVKCCFVSSHAYLILRDFKRRSGNNMQWINGCSEGSCWEVTFLSLDFIFVPEIIETEIYWNKQRIAVVTMSLINVEKGV